MSYIFPMLIFSSTVYIMLLIELSFLSGLHAAFYIVFSSHKSIKMYIEIKESYFVTIFADILIL